MKIPAAPESFSFDRLPELRGAFERVLNVARCPEARTVGNIELADRLINELLAFHSNTTPVAWQDIDTAPKDGTKLLMGDCDAVWIGHWDAIDDAWLNRDYDIQWPCYWRPLPTPPEIP